MILIVTSKFNLHADLVIRNLEKRSGEFVRINTEDFPSRIRLIHTNYGTQIQLPNRKIVSLSEIKCTWYYHVEESFINPQIIDPVVKSFVKSESEAALMGSILNLDCRWLNYPVNLWRARYRLYQLKVAKKIGFNIPDTLVTNSPLEAKKFLKKYNYKIIGKIVGQQIGAPGAPTIFTNMIGKNNTKKLNSVALAPCLFQEMISKKLELRITVVEKKVFAVSIDSQKEIESQVDWRKIHPKKLVHKIFKLPPDISDLCVLLVKTLGLNYGAVDMILTPESKYVFLEINPSGAWGWLEHLTGIEVSKEIANFLIKHDK